MKGTAIYHITVMAKPGDVPPINRLRRYLKALARVHRLRCTEVLQAEVAALPPAGKGSEADA
jgi:hypothetical protein